MLCLFGLFLLTLLTFTLENNVMHMEKSVLFGQWRRRPV